MVADDGRLSFETRPHPDGYIVLPCKIGPLYDFEMALHTTRPLSYLSPDAADAVALFGDITWVGGDIHRVRNMTIDGHPFPDLFVRISSGPALLGFDGFLGLHFLKQFRQVCFDQPTAMLTLSI